MVTTNNLNHQVYRSSWSEWISSSLLVKFKAYILLYSNRGNGYSG